MRFREKSWSDIVGSFSQRESVVENHGLIVDAEVFQANGAAERDAALIMLEAWRHAPVDGGRRQKDSTAWVVNALRDT